MAKSEYLIASGAKGEIFFHYDGNDKVNKIGYILILSRGKIGARRMIQKACLGKDRRWLQTVI